MGPVVVLERVARRGGCKMQPCSTTTIQGTEMNAEQKEVARALRREVRHVCDGGSMRTTEQLVMLGIVTDVANAFEKIDPAFSRKLFFKCVHPSLGMYANQMRRAPVRGAA